jgi:hypothetical protein
MFVWYLLVFRARTFTLLPASINPSIKLFIAIGPPSLAGQGDLLQIKRIFKLLFSSVIIFLFPSRQGKKLSII